MSNGDGCNQYCLVEPGFSCTTGASPSVCTVTCGDGVRASIEACDDNNTVGSDGCSATCTIEPFGHCDLSVDPNKCDVCGNSF